MYQFWNNSKDYERTDLLGKQMYLIKVVDPNNDSPRAYALEKYK